MDKVQESVIRISTKISIRIHPQTLLVSAITNTNHDGIETYTQFKEQNPHLFSYIEPVHLDQNQFSEHYLQQSSEIPCLIRLQKKESSPMYLVTSTFRGGNRVELFGVLLTDVPYFEIRREVYSDFERIIKQISNQLLNATSNTIDTQIDDALSQVGSYLQTDRSYLFLIDHEAETLTNTHEWVNTGIVPFKEELQGIPFSELPWLMEQILAYKTVQFDDTSKIPDVGSGFRKEMEKEGIKSIVVVPIMYENSVIAFTGFDSVKYHKIWDDTSISFLRIIGEIFVNAIKRLAFIKSMQRSQYLYQTMFDNIKEGVFVSNFDGDILEWNNSFEEIFEYRGEEVGELNTRDLYWDENQRPQVIEYLVNRRYTKNLEIDMRTKSGRKIHVKTTVSKQEDPHTDTPIFFSIIRDVTKEMRQQERNLQQQKLESLGILASGIAHDFNNILMGVLGYAEIGEELSGDSELADIFRNISAATSRASTLVDQLLTFAGSSETSPEAGNINEVISGIRDILLVGIKHKSLITYELDDGIPETFMDKNQLERLVLNLVLNADEANEQNPDTERKIWIRTAMVHLEPATLDKLETNFFLTAEHFTGGQYIEIQVEDRGLGIPEKTLTLIFDPFYSTKFTGRGLGLASVLGVVKQHHGAITITTKERQGTIFSIYLPVRLNDQEARED